MSPRAFWNLAGRAGRVNQESVGIVGLAAGQDPTANRDFVSKATGALISRLMTLLDDVEKAGELNQLSVVIQNDQWADFRCYVAHLWNEKKSLDAVLAESEQLLRNTYGFSVLRGQPDDSAKKKTEALLRVTGEYARKLADNPRHAALADETGFSPEGVQKALSGLNRLERKLTPSDWEPKSLFGDTKSSPLPNLIGIMMHIPQIQEALAEIRTRGFTYEHIANITCAWVDGRSIQQIAKEFFTGKTDTETITNACKAIYRVLTNNGAWGLSALSKIGVDFDKLSEEEKRRINSLPAMIYHGVKTEAAVLMRMNSVPRSVAEPLGVQFERATDSPAANQTVGVAREFLKTLTSKDWGRYAPKRAAMSGNDYKEVWRRLSGEFGSE